MTSIRAKTAQAQELLQAAVDGNVDVLKEASRQTLLSTTCQSGCTALHWAAGTNQVTVLEYLISERQVPVDIAATKKSRGRTPLHYACRNGCQEAAHWLVQVGGANVHARAKHGVTAFQLAVWQNKLPICQWLVEQCHVDPAQVNDFDCAAVHWLGISPDDDLIPMADWLSQLDGISFHSQQRQGHTPLHKAAWGGHLELVQYLHRHFDLWDDQADHAGNYAADLADMAHTERHAEIANYLRQFCSRARAQSCAILGLKMQYSQEEIRQAYLQRARQCHPDRQSNQTNQDEFDKIHKAYRHLMDEGGRGNQSNPAHSLPLMLQVSATNQPQHEDPECFFKARLIAVLLEYGDKGLDLSNVKKKWKQVWPTEPFPKDAVGSSLSEFLVAKAGDVIRLERDSNNALRVFPKNCTQDQVAQMAQAKTQAGTATTPIASTQ